MAQGGRGNRAATQAEQQPTLGAAPPAAPLRIRQRGCQRPDQAAVGHARRARREVDVGERRVMLDERERGSTGERKGHGSSGVAASVVGSRRHHQPAAEEPA